MIDETAAVQATVDVQPSPAPVETQPIYEPDVKPEKIIDTAQFLLDHPLALADVAKRTGFVTQAQVEQRILQETAGSIIELSGIPVEWQPFIREAKTSDDMRARAKQVQAAVKPVQATGTTATQSSPETATEADPLVIQQPVAVSREIKTYEDALDSFAEITKQHSA